MVVEATAHKLCFLLSEPTLSRRTNDSQEHRLPSQASLDMVASLISEPARWNDWLSRHPDRWHLFLENFRHAVRLEFATSWTTRTVLTELGCQVRTTDELGKMEDDELERCRDYFEWVETLTDLLGTVDERRRVLSGASLLFRDCKGSIAECKLSLSAGDFPGIELLKLGEIEKAWTAARLHLDGPIGERVRTQMATNPFSRPRPHLSGDRLDRYLDPAGGLDAEMRERIRRHLENCTQCRSACEAREATCWPQRPASVA